MFRPNLDNASSTAAGGSLDTIATLGMLISNNVSAYKVFLN